MKQLEVINIASLTEKSSKIQHRVVSQYQRKYMAQKHVIDYIQETFSSLLSKLPCPISLREETGVPGENPQLSAKR